jgi:hypothetical protein
MSQPQLGASGKNENFAPSAIVALPRHRPHLSRRVRVDPGWRYDHIMANRAFGGIEQMTDFGAR